MNRKMAIAASAMCLVFFSCHQSPTEYAKKWTAGLKEKILKESGQQPDKTTIDSSKRIITHYKNGVRLKEIYFADREYEGIGPIGVKKYDTVKYVYFSTDQNYQFVIDPCVNKVYRSYETVAFKGNSFGLVQYIECGSKIKEIGYHYNNDNVGPWIKYDTTGKQVNKVETGNEEKLDVLRTMKY